MKVLTKFYLNKKSNRIIDEFYIKNDKLSLTDLLLKSTYKKSFNEYLKSNVLYNHKSEECLVCYDTNSIKYKVPCCDKQYICLDCFEKFFVNSKFNCLFCRKDIFPKIIFDIRTVISNKLNQKLLLKVYQRKKEILNSNYLTVNDKIMRDEIMSKFLNYLLRMSYDIDDIEKIEFIDYSSFELTWNNGTKMYIINKNKQFIINSQYIPI